MNMSFNYILCIYSGLAKEVNNCIYLLKKHVFHTQLVNDKYFCLGPFFCELYGMFGSLFGCGSIWTMVFIALDRYNVIVKGLSAQPLTKKTAMLRILLIWAMSVGWTLAPIFGWNR